MGSNNRRIKRHKFGRRLSKFSEKIKRPLGSPRGLAIINAGGIMLSEKLQF
jgi:hypothetical protein